MNIVEAPSPIYISTLAADSFVNIINIFAGSPPSPSLLDEIMKLLLVLHKPSECFITHDRSKFYFLISPDPPLKQKLLNLPLPSRQFTQIIRERKRIISSSVGTTRRLELQQRKRNSYDRYNDNNRQKYNNYDNDITNEEQRKQQQENFLEYNCIDVDDYYVKQNENENNNRNLRIPIFENLKNLQSIVNCTHLSNKKAASVFNSIETERFNTSLFNMKKQREYFIQDQRNRTRKISRKRIKIISKLNSEYEIQSKKRKRGKAKILFCIKYSEIQISLNFYLLLDKSTSESSEKDFDLFTSKEYDVVQSDEVSSLNDCKKSNKSEFKKKASITKTEFTGYPGIIRLQEKLFLLLKDFLLILPDSMVDEV